MFNLRLLLIKLWKLMPRSLYGHIFLLFTDKCLGFWLFGNMASVYWTLGEIVCFPMWGYPLSQIRVLPALLFVLPKRFVEVSHLVLVAFFPNDKHIFICFLALHMYSLVKCCSYWMFLCFDVFILIEILCYYWFVKLLYIFSPQVLCQNICLAN